MLDPVRPGPIRSDPKRTTQETNSKWCFGANFRNQKRRDLRNEKETNELKM